MISLESARTLLKQLPQDLIQRFRAVEVILFDFDGRENVGHGLVREI